LLVLASDDEGFPNVLLEAMAARTPVITTPAGDAAFLVKDGDSGYLTPFNDAAAIAARMVELAESPRLCAALAAAGRRRVEQQYSLERLSDHLFKIYRDLAERRHDRRLLQALSLRTNPVGVH
jgi:glycosyltransferase involved in cell wall biosynthesis